MGVISQNPTVSLQANIGSPLLLYLADGVAIFGCIGNPEGVISANKRSLALSDNGNIYFKTTDTVNTGWVASGGGGGGTVTSVGIGGNAIFDFGASTSNPIVGAGTFNINFVSQLANRVFASPSGAAGIPSFRALTSADLAAAAAPPANGVQYNDGTNAFTASNGFKFDPASNTAQVGESSVLKGTLQFFAALGLGSIKLTVNNPASNYVYIFKDTLPTNNDLAQFSVSGSNVTISSIAASALGFPTINATDGVIPYRSSASAFSDSPITRNGTNQISIANVGSFAGLQITGNAAGSGVTLQVTSSGSAEGMILAGKGTGGGQWRNNTTNAEYWVYTRNDSGGSTYAAVGRSSDSGFKVDALGNYAFSNTGANALTPSDCDFKRLAAGVIRVGNGSTGAGQLAVGSSTASTANQFLVDSQSTTRIAGFFSMPNGSSVATIQGVTNAIQSFAFMPSGKLIGGCNIPTANQQFSALGNAKSDVSTIGNVGGGNDNLLSFALGANVLANTGDYVEFEAFGDFAANANNKTLQVVYGATTIFNTGAVAFNGSNWRMNVKILRTGSSAGKSIATFWSNDATTPFLQEIFITTEDFTASKTIQWKGESAASATDDIRQLHLESKLTVALTS